MLDLAPESETILQQEARRAGVSVDTLIKRTFTPSTLSTGNPMLELLHARLREAENATPEEVAEANALHLQWQQGMDENRRANGERLLFSEASQS